MNHLAVILTEQEKISVANELSKLYAFQDRPLANDKKAYLVAEITSHGIPYGAIIAGIKSLFAEDLKNIKLPEILSACREHIERGETEILECDHCAGRGTVLLSDPDQYEKLLLCVCGNAVRWGGHNLAQWNGENIQVVKGKTLQIPERFRKKVRV